MDSHRFSRSQLERTLRGTIGKTLGELDKNGVLSGKASNKGNAGAVFEQSVLGYPADSRQEPDLIVDDETWELKVTGLIPSTKSERGWRAKEPVSITAVSPNRICAEEFHTSAFWHKAERLLMIYYLYVKPGEGVKFAQWATFEVKGFDFHTWSEIDVERLKSDWELVRDFVRVSVKTDVEAWLPHLSTSINPHLLYLDTSPKYPHPPRFRLKASVVTAMAEACFLGAEKDAIGARSMGELVELLDDISDAYTGFSLEQIANNLGLALPKSGTRTSKNSVEWVMTALITGKPTKMSKIPLFKKAGIEFKSVVISSKGSQTEDMKLEPQIDFDELCDPSVDFAESSFGAKFIDKSIVCAVFQEESKNCDLSKNRFLGFRKIWLGIYESEAHKVWERMRQLVFSGELIDVPVYTKDGCQRIAPKTKLPVSAPNWPKSTEGVVFVRGSGKDAGDKTVIVNGVRMYKQYVWIRGDSIAHRVNAASDDRA